MAIGRLSQLTISDDEDTASPTPPGSVAGDGIENKRKPILHLSELDDEEEGEDEMITGEEEEEEDSEGDEEILAHPAGEVLRVSGEGREERSHFNSFEYDNLRYQLEDPVLLTPKEDGQKPYVAIIKDITQTREGRTRITRQWFYRPEEIEQMGGGDWQSHNMRELVYTFHQDEVSAESIMHKCVVHFIPLNKEIPHRKHYPGFIVQRVYDIEQRRLFKVTDRDYEDNHQHQIDLLVEKTIAQIGNLPDLESEDKIPGDLDKIKTMPLQLTGESNRDKWLEKLLQSIQFACTPVSNDEEKGDYPEASNKGAVLFGPAAAVPIVVALEKAANETLDLLKYNQKMRQLVFNLKSNAVLANRLLSRELEPVMILHMSPNELKEGLTAEEIVSREPEDENVHIQMTDARCGRCSEKKVGLTDIIRAGRQDRYQLECVACGNTWSALRDEMDINIEL